MGPIGFPETSVRNYHYSMCSNLEERSSPCRKTNYVVNAALAAWSNALNVFHCTNIRAMAWSQTAGWIDPYGEALLSYGLTLYRCKPCKVPKPRSRNSVESLECICNFLCFFWIGRRWEPRRYKLKKKRKKGKKGTKKCTQTFYDASYSYDSAHDNPDFKTTVTLSTNWLLWQKQFLWSCNEHQKANLSLDVFMSLRFLPQLIYSTWHPSCTKYAFLKLSLISCP